MRVSSCRELRGVTKVGMENVVPIVAGIACGALGGAPYAVAFLMAKKRRDATVLPAVVAACLSIVVVALSVLVGWAFLRPVLLEFAIALVITFLAFIVVSVACIGHKPRP